MAFIYAHQLYFTGSIDLHSGSFTNASNPTQSTDLTNKRYVDTLVDTIISGSDRFIGLKDTISSFNQYRLLFETSGSINDSSNLTFNYNTNTFEVGGDIIIKPKSAGNYPRFYFYNSPSGSKFFLNTYASGDVSFKSGSSDILYLSSNFVRSTKNIEVTGSAHVQDGVYFGSSSRIYESQSGSLRTNDNFSISQALGLGSNNEVIFYYSSSGVSPNKTVFLLAQMENGDEVIVSSRIV